MGWLLNTAIVLIVTQSAAAQATPIGIGLGTAGAFAVLAGSGLTNTGATTIDGSVGVSPSSSISGFSSVVVTNGSVYGPDSTTAQAQSDLVAAYNSAAGETGAIDLSGQNLGGLTLAPGVYSFSSSAFLTGTLTLNAENDPNAVFVFQIDSALTTASASTVAFINGGSGDQVYWQVGSTATLGTSSLFSGNILALSNITLTTGADIACGRALARNGAVTLEANSVSIDDTGCTGPTASAMPEPGSMALLGLGLAGALTMRRCMSPGRAQWQA